MMDFPEPRAAYIHVPFCVHRCGYCDFTLVANRDDLIGDYLAALEIELQSLEQPREVDTVFLGGGTPTQLDPNELEQLLDLIGRWFPIAEDGEFSTEANPDGLSREKVDVLAEGGVNRVSLGVQSFDHAVLRVLERRHASDDIAAAVDRVRQRIDNVSLDLIFGVPGQSLESWNETLVATIALHPNHISTYGLTFEKGTAFWSRRERGDLIETHPEIEREMYRKTMELLPESGYEQYELSNFARTGYRCRHNETYWAAEPYFAFGPGAARYLNGRRETNHRSVFGWLKRIQSGQSPVADVEEMTDEERAREAIVVGLRRTDGISRQHLFARFGLTPEQLARRELARHQELGNLEDDGDNIRLTPEGRFFADSVVMDFL